MRNSTSGGTSKTTNAPVQDGSPSSKNAARKTSAKKLKQARLPFKVIAPGTPLVDTKPATTLTAAEKDKVGQEETTEVRKRKLSTDEAANECSTIIDGHATVSKENVQLLATAAKKKKTSDISPEVISLLEDDEEYGQSSIEDVASSSVSNVLGGKDESASPKTPKAIFKDKRKGAGTPQSSSSVQKDKIGGSASRLQIKLPLSAGKKNKRRKSKLHQLAHTTSGTDEASSPHNSTAQEFSSDDIEEMAVELNPQKRKKPNEDCDEKENESSCKSTQDVKTITLDSEPDVEEKEEEKPKEDTKLKQSTKGLSGKEKLKNDSLKKLFEQNGQKNKMYSEFKERRETRASTISAQKESSTTLCSDKTEESAEVLVLTDEIKEDNKMDLDVSAQSDNDNEADDETDNISARAVNNSFDLSDDAKSKLNTTLDPNKDTPPNTNATVKTHTPKQVKLMEQRRKAREEKERKLHEEKMKKQQEKEERELAKKREREEKEEQKRKEREDKEEQKRKEREEKERKRLAELEAKNEEKRKKTEAKEEELRKKEEERKRKEQEKEEAELKKKKAAQAFSKFFVAKAPTNNQPKNDGDSNTSDGTKLLAFRPFQVKGDMKLAPVCRKIFTPDNKSLLDNVLGYRHKTGDDDDDNEIDDVVHRKPLTKSQLYLSELRSGKIVPGKWRRPSTESKDDVIVVEDELERVGQAIVEDTPAYIREQMRVKFYKFHDNRRPPYYGTWRKKSSVVKPRRPFAQDKNIFDYDVDSDDEWEEDEPGESLEDGSDDDKEKESEDDDYEVDNEWFVPHGHLSDEELQNEDEYGIGDDNTREAQKVKLQILQQEFAQEMKKKTEKIKPRLIGCIWADINGNQPADCANILWDALEKKAMLFTDSPLVEEVETEKYADPTSPMSTINGNQEKPTADKLKPITLTDDMVKDLTRLLHGNNHSKNFLINEYIAYVEKTEESVKNGDLRKPLKSVIRDKIDEIAEWQVVDATASTIQDMEQNTDETAESNKKKKKGKRRLCWVVKQEVLNKMNLSALELQNSWQYTLPPKFVKADKDVKTGENIVAVTKTGECISTATADSVEDTAKEKEKSSKSQITKFTKVLTAEEKIKKLSNSANSTAETKSNSPSTSQQHSKEKKRVPLLVSVARGQQISTPAKNKLISQFLQQKSRDKDLDSQKTSSAKVSNSTKVITSQLIEDDDDIVILD